MKIIIDSSVFIDFLRGGKAADEIFDKIEELDAEIFIPTIVIFELFSGQSSKKPLIRTKIANLIRNFKRVELTEEIAVRAGELYREFGKHIGVSDYIIAASALSIGGEVLTLNRKHFEQIPNLVLYEV
jgi:predicted nucleic acid-binding protein